MESRGCYVFEEVDRKLLHDFKDEYFLRSDGKLNETNEPDFFLGGNL